MKQNIAAIMAVALIIMVCVGATRLFFDGKKIDRLEYERCFNSANRMFADGNYDGALATFKKLFDYDSGYPVVAFNIGRSYARKQQFQDALDWYKKTLELKPSFMPFVHFSAGLAYYNLKNKAKAAEHFKRTLALDSSNADAHFYLGKLAHEDGTLEAALLHMQKAVSLCNNESYALSLMQLGMSFRDELSFDRAITCYAYAQQLDPYNYYTYLLLGDALNMKGNPDRALTMYKKACGCNPQCHEAYNNMGCIYSGYYGDLDSAFDALQTAMKIKPDHAGTHCGLSCIYLARGDFERGWREYEWRLANFFQETCAFKAPRWDGSSLQGKTIVLHAEQGLGDTFQFIRYAQVIKEQGAHVIVQVQQPLVSILSLCPYIDEIITAGASELSCDFQAPLMSMPFLCKTELTTIPHELPYLFSDSMLDTLWRKKLSNVQELKVGICWRVDKGHDADIYRAKGKKMEVATLRRSTDLENFFPLARMKGIRLYSLQKNVADELKSIPEDVHIYDFGPNFDEDSGPFMDTAAIIKSLDLILTVDTSIAHLAGGLGVPVWILLPYPAEWRWMLDRDDSPWYPTMRLFRQKRETSWQDLFGQVQQELALLIR